MVTSTQSYEFEASNDKDVTSVFLETLSEAWSTKDIAPDPNWFQGKSDFISTLGQQLNSPKGFWDKLKGFLLNIATSATIGAGLGAIGGPIGAIGGAIVGGVAGSLFQPITALVNFIGSKGSQAQSLVQDISITAIVGGAGFIAAKNGLGSALGLILNQTDFLYDFNWDIPDSQIWKQIKGLIDGLYGQAGDFLGSSFARLLLLGSLEPPKIEVDIRGLAITYSEFAEDKREDLLSGVSAFAYQGVVVSQRVGFLFAFMRGRTAFRDFILKTPDIEKNYPKIAAFAKEWGDEENTLTKESEVKDWRVSTWVENKFEDIKKNYGSQIGNFIEQFFEGFTDEIRDILEDYVVYKFV
ncbi:hypothetical protein [Planktothrix paucivesiculata]|uniref:Uncharacterized protein n=1 Tax=Planktothrix paucivesiculata PCC 9631 TaxID=671071 RepID=A0A7Z9BNH5_9CYAN|nr:hypothetical protein [Planktothrix paucivesiculata]VXD18736.1 membrane hypothetical protein [Planktothrix paucivesiculata PCC 9631]